MYRSKIITIKNKILANYDESAISEYFCDLFQFNGHLPNGKEPLTTLRASIIVNKDSLKINKYVKTTES